MQRISDIYSFTLVKNMILNYFLNFKPIIAANPLKPPSYHFLAEKAVEAIKELQEEVDKLHTKTMETKDSKDKVYF